MDQDEEKESPRRYLVCRPKPLQYFHNGKLKRESEGERQAGRFELFLDLLYVALVANFADNLAEDPSGARLLKYVLIFSPAWHAWSDLKEIMNSYYNDDLLQRVLILWLMALLVIYGNNATAVDEDISALRTTVGVYMVARLTTLLTYTLYSVASHFHRPQIYAGLTFLGLFIWIPLFFESISIRAKIAVAVTAIIYEELVWLAAFGPWIKTLLRLTYSTAVDIPHEVDRQAAFYIIILGEFLYSIIVGSPAAFGLNLGTLKAVWTLVIAFCLNWLYVNGDGSLKAVHPLRRAIWSAFTWLMIHLPLAASLLIGGHICAISVGEEELSVGERWLWGGGLGAGLLVLFIMSMCFKSSDSADALWLPKIFRMAPRFLGALTLALLPITSPEQLNPTKLLCIGAALFVFLVVWETVGGLQRSVPMFESWKQIEPSPREDTESSSNGLGKNRESTDEAAVGLNN